MADEELLTIDELARRTGMTVRNVRAHQSRGLLPPPTLRGRTGYYGEEHRARIELIRELQGEGFNLEAIRKLLAGAGGASAELLRFTRAVREPFEEPGREVPIADFGERFGADPALLQRAFKLGILRPLGEGWVEDVAPTLSRAGQELVALGVAPDTALDVVARLRKHSEGAARAFVELFLEEIWKPFDAAGRPPERWPEVRETLERLRPLASDALLAVFRIVMDEQVERAFGRVLDKPSRK